MKGFIVAGLGAFLIGGFLLLWLKPRSFSQLMPSVKIGSQPLEPPASSAAQIGTFSPLPERKEVSPRLLEFLAREASLVDRPKIDAEAALKRGQLEADQMQEKEFLYARTLALTNEAPANQRILAAFLLSLALPRSSSALGELILSPMTTKPDQAHSVGEVKHAQERAIKIMAIDALAEEAQKNPSVLDSLNRMEQEIRDQSLQQYLRKKIKELR